MHQFSGLMDVLVKGHYYLDPGSGSFLLQILLAVLLGSGYAVKVYWKKIKSFFKKSSPSEEETPAPVEEKNDDNQ